MAKISLKARISSDLENLIIDTFGIKNKNKITYRENNILVTLLILDNRIEMNRSCNDYKIDLIFDENNNTKSTYSLVSNSKNFELETITKKLIISDDSVEINYILEGTLFKYKLDWRNYDIR